MVKRKWIYTLPIVILLLFIGCTSRTQVGICLRDTNEGITLPLMQRLTAELKDHGYQVTAVGAVNDQAEQTEQIHHFLDEKYDLLIVEPVITAEAYTVVQQAREANVPVIFLNYEPDPALLNSWEKLSADFKTKAAAQTLFEK